MARPKKKIIAATEEVVENVAQPTNTIDTSHILWNLSKSLEMIAQSMVNINNTNQKILEKLDTPIVQNTQEESKPLWDTAVVSKDIDVSKKSITKFRISYPIQKPSMPQEWSLIMYQTVYDKDWKVMTFNTETEASEYARSRHPWFVINKVSVPVN